MHNNDRIVNTAVAIAARAAITTIESRLCIDSGSSVAARFIRARVTASLEIACQSAIFSYEPSPQLHDMAASAAAEALFTTQSAVSARVRLLEHSMGAKLFDRTTRSVHLTRIASEMLPAIDRILGDSEALIGQGKDISAGIAGRAVIAALPSVSATVLPSAIAMFRAKYPRISIVLKDALAETIVAMLRGGEVDFAISSPIVGDAQLSFALLATDHMAAVFPRAHPLQSVKKLRLEQLAEYLIILREKMDSDHDERNHTLIMPSPASKAVSGA